VLQRSTSTGIEIMKSANCIICTNKCHDSAVYIISIINLTRTKNVNINKIVQSNFGRGNVATPGDRSTHSRHTQSFICVCPVALVCTPLNTRFLWLTPYTIHQLHRFTAVATFSLYVTLHCPSPRKLLHLICGSLDQPDPLPQLAS